MPKDDEDFEDRTEEEIEAEKNDPYYVIISILGPYQKTGA